MRKVSPSCIDLEQDLAERVIGARPPRPDRVIAFAQSGEQIRHRLQRADDVFARAHDETQPAATDDQGERPLHLGRVIAEPKERERHQRRGKRGTHGQPGDPAFVGKTLPRLAFSRGGRAIHAQRRARLQTIMLQPSIEGAPAQAERLGRAPRVAIESAQGLLDQERFHFLETHVLDARGIFPATR